MTCEARGFHELAVKRIERETSDSVSLTLAVPDRLRSLFAYRAGQFVTIRCELGGEPLFRSYSMSSAPEVDPDLAVTVKRVAGGSVSNWLNDCVREGDRLAVNAPGGEFVLDDEGSGDVLAFAAGSGITPVLSIVKWALAKTARRVRVLYANRDEPSTIFREALDRMCSEHPDRLHVEYTWDDKHGFIDGGTVTRFVGTRLDAQFYICGPTPFMDLVDATLMWNGVRRQQVHIERFTPLDVEPPTGQVDEIEVVVTINGKTSSIPHRSKATILQTARSAGLRAPSSCETGGCATCMARVVEGRTDMRHNGALTPEEVAEGWVLTCQAVPVTPVVRVVYE